MKRFSLVLLVFIMILSTLALTSCSKTTEQIVTSAMKKLDEANAVDATMKLTVTTDVMGVSSDTEMTYAMKMTDLLTDTPKFSAVSSTEILGQKMDIGMYCDGAILYLSMLGQKLKLDISDAASDEYNVMDTFESVNVTLPEEMLEKTVYTVDEDGNYVLNFELTAEEFTSIFSIFAEELASDADADVYAFGAVKYGLVITPELNLKLLTLEVPVSVTVEGATVSMTTAMEMTFNTFAGNIELDVPADLDSYVEMPGIG